MYFLVIPHFSLDNHDNDKNINKQTSFLIKHNTEPRNTFVYIRKTGICDRELLLSIYDFEVFKMNMPNLCLY